MPKMKMTSGRGEHPAHPSILQQVRQETRPSGILSFLPRTHSPPCFSDEEDFETLDWLPMAPEIEDPEEPGWGQLEVHTQLLQWNLSLAIYP